MKDCPIPIQENTKSLLNRRDFMLRLGCATAAICTTGVTCPSLFFSMLDSQVADEATTVDVARARYEPLYPLILNGRNLQLIGVRHSADTFYAYREDIKARLQNAPFIILEYFDKRSREVGVPATTDEELFNIHTYDDTVTAFFGGVGKLCAEAGKDIIVVNPQSGTSIIAEAGLMFGVPPALLFSRLHSFLLNKAEKAVGQKIPVKWLWRKLAYMPSLAALSGWLGLSRDAREYAQEKGFLTTNLPKEHDADVLGWHFFDWRDVNSAIGVMKAFELYASEIAPSQTPLMYQGALHGGVVEYLLKEKLRIAKAALYPQNKIFGEYTVRRYWFDPAEQMWFLGDKVRY